MGMTSRRPVWLAAAVSALVASSAEARPYAPPVFCQTYPEAPVCAAGDAPCSVCHVVPPARNRFGEAVETALLAQQPRPWTSEVFVSLLPEALRAIEDQDADGDGAANGAEIAAGTLPHDASSFPSEDSTCPESKEANGGYDVCNYDARYVYRKVLLDFCGETATFSQLRDFDQAENPRQLIHDTLDQCLDTDHWLGRNGVLYQLAHKKIRPVQSIKSGRDEGGIPLGDYDDDYFLFVYTQLDNRDAREMLTATYYVEVTDGRPPVYTAYTRDPFADVIARGAEVAQLVATNRRAGLLTTRWNLVLNTMFTAIPRTTAAQAYRAYLGLDIARMEGLVDVPGEPVDYDRKGVTEPACARCHATLDPLSYPFTTYAGFNGGIPFSYSPNRMRSMSQGPDDPLRNTPEAGVLFGTPVADLLAWAQVAANSEAFARSLTSDYWRYLMGEDPRPLETEEFDRLWRDLMSVHNYGVERLLHALIDTEAYGVP